MNQHKLAQLPFVKIENGQINLWPPELVDHLETAPEELFTNMCAIGRQRADDLVSYMEREQAPFLFGHVTKAIADSGGAHGGLATGFFSRIGELLLDR